MISRQVILNHLLPTLAQRNVSIFIYGHPGSPIPFDFNDPFGVKKYNSLVIHMNTHVANEALVYHLAKQYQQQHQHQHQQKRGREEEDEENGVKFFGINPGLIHKPWSMVTDGESLFEVVISKLGNNGTSRHVRGVLNIVASCQLKKNNNEQNKRRRPPSGAIFDTFGEAIMPNTKIKPHQWETIYQFVHDKIQQES